MEIQNKDSVFYELNDDNINGFIEKGSKIVLLYMSNSSSSTLQENNLETIYESYSDKVDFGKVDVLTEQDFAINNNFRSFPVTLYYRDGNLEMSSAGVQSDIEMSLMSIL